MSFKIKYNIIFHWEDQIFHFGKSKLIQVKSKIKFVFDLNWKLG